MSHKHAEVLRAIADGVPLSEFEVRHCLSNSWSTFCYAQIIPYPDEWEVRRKPQYIMVNGFKVPKPLDSADGNEKVWVPDFERDEMVFSYSSPLSVERVVKLRCAHSTKEAAISHAKAMLGIDPEA